MSWLELHRKSEEFASKAEVLARQGQYDLACTSYLEAAHYERQALAEVDAGKRRTWTITAVSTSSLYFMAHELEVAEDLAHRFWTDEQILPFGKRDLDELLQMIRDDEQRAQALMDVDRNYVHASIRGDRIPRGAAPAGVVESAVRNLSSLLTRAAEFTTGLAYRTTARTPKRIRDEYQPIILQSAAGSYQFAVTLAGPAQPKLIDDQHPSRDEVVRRALQIMSASAQSPTNELLDVVPDLLYRRAFLSLVRDLSPTGRFHEALELQPPNAEYTIKLSNVTRERLKSVLDEISTAAAELDGEHQTLTGTLGGVDLINDWIKVESADGVTTINGIRSSESSQFGLLLASPVIVTAKTSASGKLSFLDIERDG